MARIILLLRIATAGVFLGRAWQHLFWDAPLRTLLWDESWLATPVAWLGYTEWTDWVTSPQVDAGIQLTIRGLGVIYLLCAIAAVLVQPGKRWWLRWPVQIGGCLLMGLALLYMKEKFYHLGQFLEYSLQFGVPFFLLAALRQMDLRPLLRLAMRWAIALTFVCHGLYAYGYYPRPVTYMRMTMQGFFVTQNVAALILVTAGILDFIAGFLLVLRWRPGHKVALLYCVFWGFVTAWGRIWGHLFVSTPETVLTQWVHEFVMRFPHFLVPLALWLYYRTVLDSQNLGHPDEVVVR